MKAVVQCDFDGTIILNNMSVLLREKFAGDEWRAIEADYLAGRLTVEESNRRQYLLVREPREVLQSFVFQNVRIRPGFLDFVKYCQTSNLRLAIVSSGLDFYVETALQSIGIPKVEVYCARTVFGQDGIAVKYIGPEGYEVTDGFKQRYMAWFRKYGEPVIYIGDGLSDLEPAKVAEYVFATGHLHSLLEEASILHHPFSSFLEIMRRMTLASFRW